MDGQGRMRWVKRGVAAGLLASLMCVSAPGAANAQPVLVAPAAMESGAGGIDWGSVVDRPGGTWEAWYASLTSEQKKASTLKVVKVDPKTGAYVGWRLGTSDDVWQLAEISQHSPCAAGSDACYYSGRFPYADRGFYGSRGTKSGNWPYRDSFFAGVYSASACWATGCTGTVGPGSVVGLGSVTGTSVTIH